MRSLTKTLTALAVAGGTLLGAKAAMAGTHGVVFIHGTGEYAGTQGCSGTGSGWKCTVPSAVTGYWKQGTIDSMRNGRSYAVVGFHGGNCAPWAIGGEYGTTDGYGSTGSCGNAAGQGNGDVIASQIARYLRGPDNVAGTSDDVTDIVIVTHSGGSNQARYILQNYTKSTDFTKVKNATRRVVTIAAPTMGTYLANKAMSGGITGWLADMGGYGGEGVNFIRTDHMATYNTSSSFFGGFNNPVSGVNFYSTGGTSGSTCYGVKVWGVCVGVTGQTLGGSSCDSLVDDIALLALHVLYLHTNDSSTARDGCSDGFISCMSAKKLGNNFSFAEKQDHNQSHRQCHGLDVSVRNMVSGAMNGFAYDQVAGAQATPKQLDACGFSTSGTFYAGSYVAGYHYGCSKSDLGDGYCDPSCVAIYGNDAKPTWDATGTKVIGWASTGDCSSASTGGDIGAYAFTSAFNGKTGQNAGDGGKWFSDPLAGTANAAANCPQSLINDGVCDECALALYGNDGTDCMPGQVTKCGPTMSYLPGYYCDAYGCYTNPVSNNGYLTYNSTTGWNYNSYAYTAIVSSADSTLVGDGICEMGECGSSAKYPGTGQCDSDADCASGTCIAGGCTVSGKDCSVNYAVPQRTCAADADCNGNVCSSGTCALTGDACTLNSDCPVPASATSKCNAGVCTCSTSSDCNDGAACNSGTCAASVTTSLCR